MATKGTFEKNVISRLDGNGVKYEYEPDSLPYTISRNYIPDLKLENGVYVEMKGYFRRDAQKKMRLVKEQHPGLDIRFLFQRANSPIEGAQKRKDGTKMNCAQWADRYGFEWAEGFDIPTDWINEVKK